MHVSMAVLYCYIHGANKISGILGLVFLNWIIYSMPASVLLCEHFPPILTAFVSEIVYEFFSKQNM